MIDITGTTASVYYASVLHQESFTRVQLKNIEFCHFKTAGGQRDCSRVLLIGKQYQR